MGGRGKTHPILGTPGPQSQTAWVTSDPAAPRTLLNLPGGSVPSTIR